jgi:hypothetical protein
MQYAVSMQAICMQYAGNMHAVCRQYAGSMQAVNNNNNTKQPKDGEGRGKKWV